MKKMMIIMLLTLGLNVNVINCNAATYNDAEEYSVKASDTIEIIYRSVNGVVQYRRWNATKECWVDPEWINL